MSRRGQSILEYTIIIGILTMVLYFMGIGIKRGVQSIIKVTADQIGNQQNAEQDFNDAQSGYMLASNTITNDEAGNQTQEIGYTTNSGTSVYMTNTAFNETTDMTTNTITNAGFIPNS